MRQRTTHDETRHKDGFAVDLDIVEGSRKQLVRDDGRGDEPSQAETRRDGTRQRETDEGMGQTRRGNETTNEGKGHDEETTNGTSNE